MAQQLLTLKQVEEQLNVSRSTVWRLVQSGALPTVRVGDRAVRVSRADLSAYIMAQRR